MRHGRLNYRHAGLSVAGPVRKNNEDTFLCAAVPSGEAGPHAGGGPLRAAGGMLFAVSDGVGGLNAGEVASRLSVDGLLRLLSAAWRKSRQRGDPGALLKEAVTRINAEVHAAAKEDPARAQMAATLTALWLFPDRAYIAQTGDSRLYRARNGRCEQLTEDQSKVARLVREGHITPEKARSHPQRNVIEQAVGMDPSVFRPEITILDVLPGDRFLLCSDGVTDGLPNAYIAEYFEGPWPADLEAFCGELIEGAIRASGRDNLTALLVEVGHAKHAAAGVPRVAAPVVAWARRRVHAPLGAVLTSVLLLGLLAGTAFLRSPGHVQDELHELHQSLEETRHALAAARAAADAAREAAAAAQAETLAAWEEAAAAWEEVLDAQTEAVAARADASAARSDAATAQEAALAAQRPPFDFLAEVFRTETNGPLAPSEGKTDDRPDPTADGAQEDRTEPAKAEDPPDFSP